MNPLLLQNVKDRWQPQPLPPPVIDSTFTRLNGFQRVTESFRYAFLRCEYWLSPSGDIREWLRHNTRIGVWLLIPTVLVMPVIGFILWQLTGWLSMLTSIASRLVVLPILILLVFTAIKIAVALLNR